MKLETEILNDKVVLRSACGEMTFPHQTFESMARLFWEDQDKCEMEYGGYDVKDTLFKYTRNGSVYFIQKDLYTIIPHEDAIDLFEFYHKNHTFAIEWQILQNGAVLNNRIFVSNEVIEHINEVYKFYLRSSHNYETLGGTFNLNDEFFYTFTITDKNIKIHHYEQPAIFDRHEWNIFLAELKRRKCDG